MQWVCLQKYSELSGETQEAVRIRRKRGIWADGKQTKIGPNGRIWVNLEEANKWIQNYQQG